MILAWIAMALFSVGQAAVVRATSNLPPVPLATVLWIAANCGLWALYTPLIWWFSQRFAFDAGWRRATLAHAGLLAVLLAVDAMYNAWLVLPVLGMPAKTPLRSAADLLFIDLLCYAVTIAIEHGRRHYWLSSRLESDLRQARLQALEAQLRPHFLFNALNTVSSLIRASEDQAAINAIAALGDVLRGSLRQTAPEVALRDELGLAERYLDLERARFGDALSFTVEAEPETAAARVPSLLLQPLVENALKHGRAQDGKANVRIRARREGPDLRIEVRDSGSGPARGASEGIGLSNTRARLRQLYGERGRLELTAAQGGGALAVVQLPLHEAAGG
ncbi:MAG TPA: histidine kinase [Myxococcales bacterium]|nr:histidine kinase [Myxococcales bacterium]